MVSISKRASYFKTVLGNVSRSWRSDDLLLKDRGLRAIPSPKSQHYQNLFNWIMGHKPLDGGQYDFLFDRDDFVAAPTACNNANRFDEIIERCLNRWPESKVSQVCSISGPFFVFRGNTDNLTPGRDFWATNHGFVAQAALGFMHFLEQRPPLLRSCFRSASRELCCWFRYSFYTSQKCAMRWWRE